MALVNRVEIREQIRELGEVREIYVSDDALNGMINASLANLYSLLVEANPDRYITSATIYVFSGTDEYDVPSDYYKTIGLDYVSSDGTKYSLRRFNFGERNKYSDEGAVYMDPQALSTMYRDVGDKIKLIPKPSWTGELLHWYIPTPTKLTTDGQQYDFVAGWEQFIIWDCVVKCLNKEESDPKFAMQERNQILQIILKAASCRDEGEPDRVRDVDVERNYILRYRVIE